MLEPEGLLIPVPDARRAWEWPIVLAAAGIPFQGSPAALEVPAGAAAAAERELAAYEAELTAPAPPLARPAPASSAGLVVAALLVLAFALTGPAEGNPLSVRVAAGARHALGGEPWRAVTALTMHVDHGHLAGNAVALALLGGALGRAVGGGLAALLVLGAGVLGNVLAGAAGHGLGAANTSVGASTAVFGAIGILAVHQARAGRRLPAWITLGAALALLGVLGASERADVLAHVFGLVAGLGLGFLARRAGLAAQVASAALAAGAVAAAWWLALR